KAFGMEVIGYDPFVAPFDHVVQDTGIKQRETAEEVIKEADFVSIHVPLTDDTRYLFNQKTFELMKPEASVINSARGGIVNEADIVKAVHDKQIAGAYLDVLENEPVRKGSPMSQVAAIKLSPQIAGSTEEAQTRTATSSAAEVENVV